MTALKDSSRVELSKNTKSTFLKYQATAKLFDLAKTPYDLTKEDALTPERIEKFVAEAAGYKLIYGTERITEEVMEVLFELAQESQALQKMERMQAGDVMNTIIGWPCDNRAVLHTACRDFFDHPQTSNPAKAAAALLKGEADKLKNFIHEMDKDNRYTDLVLVAIGGSELGRHANYLALEHLQKPNRRIHFVSNIDPDECAMTIKGLDLSRTLVVVASKTGGTQETLVNEEWIRQIYLKKNLNPESHFILITAKNSPVDVPSRYLQCFYMWEWVGGRFSTSSCLGGIVLSFAFGFDTYWEFLKGAHEMDKAALDKNLNRNIPLLTALLGIWNHNFLDILTKVVVPYSRALARYAAHIQQVDMESNGKTIDRKGELVDFSTGPIVWGEPGTNAQHSFYQLLHQGTDPQAIEMIGFKHNQTAEDITIEGTTSQQKLLSNLFAQVIALAEGQKDPNPNKYFPGNRPSHILLGSKLTPQTLGALFAFFEHKVAFQGFIWDINSFDQEGVQLGKVLAKKVLKSFVKKGEFELGDAFLSHLESL